MYLHEQIITIPTPHRFNFPLTIRSGWSELAPFILDKEINRITRIHKLENENVIQIEIFQPEDKIYLNLSSHEKIDESTINEVERIIIRCLRFNEDFSGFYKFLEDYPKFKWIAEIGAGRSTKSPTVYEDIIKTICSTNCSWNLTKAISRRLCEKIGDSFGEMYTFPTPNQLASKPEGFLRREIKAGYRSPYLLELSRRIIDNELDVEAWYESNLDSDSLKKEVLEIKGVGEYAANTIMRFLGRYDYLVLDSWTRKRFSELYSKGQTVSDDEIKEVYEPFGLWKGLVFSLDMSKEFILKYLGVNV